MKIYQHKKAFDELSEIASDNWDTLGELVKYIIDNHKERLFNSYFDDNFSAGIEKNYFKTYCCQNADTILNSLKKTVRKVKKTKTLRSYKMKVNMYLDRMGDMIEFMHDHLMELADEQKKEYDELIDRCDELRFKL